MGNLKCFTETLENCKKTCARTTSCRIAEYKKATKTCCTSAVATKKECKGSFVASKDWKGYVVCGAPMPKTTTKAPTLPGTTLKCGKLAGPICMGYNMKCWETTLTNCKATCKKTPGCKIAEYAAASKYCCTSRYATKSTCPGSFTTSKDWKGYVVCGSPVEKLPGISLKCAKDAGPICMGYNLKCFTSTQENCKKTCAKTPGCTIAEYSTTRTCCTSRYATKSTCPGSFTKDKSWKGYVVCGSPVEKLPGTSLKCGADAGPICMGYNLKCFTSTLENCKKTCAKTPGCKIAEYKKTTRTCCTSRYATKSTCPGSFTKDKSWKGYVVCGSPVEKLPGTSLKCGADAGPS